MNQLFLSIFDFMEVNDLLINNLSNLACLEFSELEKKEIRLDLERMISFVEKLNELSTVGVAPLLQMGEEVNALRADVVEGSISRQDALRNAPSSNGIYFKVPKVIKNPSPINK
jgi:aspartyl-tRNA(Asn)/glutamyl-tRNA(Gln) amidotransferase subunit C